MEFREVVRRRRMVRRFTREPVDAEVVERVLAHGHRAPSAGYAQGYAFLVLSGPADRERFWALRGADGDQPAADEEVHDAPVLIVPLAHKSGYLEHYAKRNESWRDEARWPVPFWYIDTGFAALLMLLTAVDEGLGALFFGIPPTVIEPFRAAFDVPGKYDPIGCIALGHPVHEPQSPRIAELRRPLDDLVHRGSWRSSDQRTPGSVSSPGRIYYGR